MRVAMRQVSWKIQQPMTVTGTVVMACYLFSMIILDRGSTNQRRAHNVRLSTTGWAYNKNDLWYSFMRDKSRMQFILSYFECAIEVFIQTPTFGIHYFDPIFCTKLWFISMTRCADAYTCLEFVSSELYFVSIENDVPLHTMCWDMLGGFKYKYIINIVNTTMEIRLFKTFLSLNGIYTD